MILHRLKQYIALEALLLAFIVIVPIHQSPVFVQEDEGSRAIDMMLVIDNSCSMFPEDIARSNNCPGWGNDPDFLRIIGTDIFLARLGFAEVNESEYQAGVISLGTSPQVVTPLQPLSGARDAIARAIADPSPEGGTNIVGALELAYQELRTSPNRRPTNLPAVVLLTDGQPDPPAGQSEADIERLVSENPDIPLFIMLLQESAGPGYEQYIRFWEEMQTQYDHIFSYRIESREHIEATYNEVIAQLQNTVPSGEGISVTPEKPYQIFVSRYVQKMVITVIHTPGEIKGNVKVEDPKGMEVYESDPGVSRFHGTDNPIEVISIAAPRLRGDLKENIWTITSDEPVTVFLDRQGAYRIKFVEPSVSLTDVNNVYLATERQTPSHEFTLRFSLVETEGEDIVSETQPIQGEVILPDGTRDPLHIPSDIKPNADGVYEVRFDFATAYPDVLEEPGRFTFIINAGSADEGRSTERIPIATAQVRVNVGRGPYIESVSPKPVICTSGQSTEITVNVRDYELAVPDTLRVRVFAGGKEVILASSSPGVFTGDVSELCASLVTGMTCSTQQATVLHLRLVAQLTDGTPLPPIERELSVQVVAPTCTPTPIDTPTPTPTPTATPIPDTDRDGFRDPVDECPTDAGIAQFNGCPVPWWVWLLTGMLGLAILAFIVFWFIPFVKVRISPPPKAYVLICRGGRSEGVKSVYSIGMAKRSSRVTIGSGGKAHIRVSGLKPVEFYVAEQGTQVKIVDAESDNPRGTVSTTGASEVPTSNPEVKLRIKLDQKGLKC